jgi:hypothetical protein
VAEEVSRERDDLEDRVDEQETENDESDLLDAMRKMHGDHAVDDGAKKGSDLYPYRNDEWPHEPKHPVAAFAQQAQV